MNKYILKDNFVLRKFKEANYVIDIETGDIRNFDDVGYTIISMCLSEISAEEVAKKWNCMSTDKDRYIKQIDAFLGLLTERGLLKCIADNN